MSRPNILIIMVDQLNGTLFSDGSTGWRHVPNLKSLATRSIRFANTYTASPFCASPGGLRGFARWRLLSAGRPAAAKTSERYMRNHMNLNTMEDSKRFPFFFSQISPPEA